MPKVKSAMTKRNPKARLMRAASFMLIAPVTKLVANSSQIGGSVWRV